MDCQCNIGINNNGTTSTDGYVIHHPQGNYLELRIPMTRISSYTVDGVVTTNEVVFPIFDVKVIFQKGPIRKEIDASVIKNTSTIIVQDNGTLPVGTYDIIVTFVGTDSRPYRYKQKTVLVIDDVTGDGGQYETNEFTVTAYYPIIRGKESLIAITDDSVTLNEGVGFYGEITENAVKLYARYGTSLINIDDDSVNIVIN